jgi:hypothetical protein
VPCTRNFACAPLGLRVVDSLERGEKARRCVDGHELDAEVATHRLLHLLALVQTQQPRIDEDAGELIADRAMHERRGHRRIDAARQAADHLRAANLLPNLADLVLDERARSPARRRTADVEQKIRDQLPAPRRVRHLRVKLHPVDRTGLVLEGGDGVACARRCDSIAGGRRLDVIAVAHPDRRFLVRREAAKQHALARRRDLVASVLTLASARDFGTLEIGDHLHSVTDAKHRRDVEERGIGERDVLAVH